MRPAGKFKPEGIKKTAGLAEKPPKAALFKSENVTNQKRPANNIASPFCKVICSALSVVRLADKFPAIFYFGACI